MPETVDELLILVAVNISDSPHPYLLFNRKRGIVEIADDYEPANDPTARDFVLSTHDAVRLATALLLYAKDGIPSDAPSINRFDVEDRLREEGSIP